MDWQIKDLQIKNFKSIKDLTLDCRRVNLFVGRPNVGKSNILEALSLLGLPNANHKGNIGALARMATVNELFYDKKITEKIKISSNVGAYSIYHEAQDFAYLKAGNEKDLIKIEEVLIENQDRKSVKNWWYYDLNNSGNVHRNRYNGKLAKAIPAVKFYTYEKKIKYSENGSSLQYPHGENLVSIIESHRELRNDIVDFLSEYNLKPYLDAEEQTISVVKIVDEFIYKTRYELIADTLRRMIFHYAAIHSNKNSVLLFEEPEAHAAPAFVKQLCDKITSDEDNQYFIVTHSPYVLNSIVENMAAEDFSVFTTSFKDYETKAKRLSNEELNELLDYGIDIFFNPDWFEHERASHIS